MLLHIFYSYTKVSQRTHFIELSQLSKIFSNIIYQRISVCKWTCSVQTYVAQGSAIWFCSLPSSALPGDKPTRTGLWSLLCCILAPRTVTSVQGPQVFLEWKNEQANEQLDKWQSKWTLADQLNSQSRGRLQDLNRIEDYELEFDGKNYRDISFLCLSQCKDCTRIKFLEWIYCWFHRWPIPHLSPDSALCN